MRALAGEGAEEIARQAHRADRDGRRTGQFLRPAGEVQALLAIDLGKLRLPEAPLRAVQDVRTGLHQRHQPLRHLLGRGGELRLVVLLLPLAHPQQDREIRPHRRAHRLEHLGGEARAFAQRRPAPGVGAAVSHRPEELVDQVAVRAVDLGHVEAEPPRIGSGAGEGGDGVGDVFLAHRHAVRIVRAVDARRAFHRHRRRPAAVAAGGAGMPQLRAHAAAGSMHRLDHPLPAGQRGLPVEERDVRLVARGRTVDHRPLGQDQADAVLGAAAVVRGHVLARHASGREAARHRRHHDAVGQRQRLVAERAEQDV